MDFFGCPLQIGRESWDCRLLLTDTGRLALGSVTIVPVKFLSSKEVLERIQVGMELPMWEGRVIGRLKVLKILSTPSK